MGLKEIYQERSKREYRRKILIDAEYRKYNHLPIEEQSRLNQILICQSYILVPEPNGLMPFDKNDKHLWWDEIETIRNTNNFFIPSEFQED